MLTLYYWPTPNGHKVTLMLEELGVPYQIESVDITKGEQFRPEFLAVAPNNRIPALIDDHPESEQVGASHTFAPLALFESGAILLYLAEKHQRFLPSGVEGRFRVLQWVFWQVSGFGPMLGQTHHFNFYASEKIPYAIDRFVKESLRLYGVLDKELAVNKFLGGNSYSIADMACYPWTLCDRQQVNLLDFPHVLRWQAEIQNRPATARAYARAKSIDNSQPPADAARAILFGKR